MKKSLNTAFFVLALLSMPNIVFAQFDNIEDLNLPKRVGYVNDFSGVFPSETRQMLEAKLKKYEQDTGRMFLVVSFPVLDCVFQEEKCSAAFYEKWQIKKARKKHHAIILFLSGANTRGKRSFLGFSHEDSDGKMVYRAGHDRFMTDVVDKLIVEGKVAEANVAYIDFVIGALSVPISN